jgi:hypothetical protein
MARFVDRKAAPVIKLPRTIRLDPSDTFVFDPAAEPGEWAVTGAFMFWDADPETLSGKARAAFRSGFVGVRSLGFSTLVLVSEATADEHAGAIATLARHFLERFGAPDETSAHAAAAEEIAVAAGLCTHPVNTIVALHRRLDGAAIKEQFRTLQPRDPRHGEDRLHGYARAFQFVETDEPEEPPAQSLDIRAIAGDRR